MNHPWTIRRALDSEVDLYIEWGNNAGWNMNPQITRNFHKAFPHGWFLCEVTPTSNSHKVDSNSSLSKVIGLLYCTKYKANNIGFIGYFMVDEKYRGVGYGAKLFQYALDNFLFTNDAGPPVTAVGLFSASTAEKYYKRFGFETKSRTARFKGKVNPILLNKTNNDEQDRMPYRLSQMNESDLEEVSRLDEKFSLVYRPEFWRNWMDTEGSGASKEFSVLYRGDRDRIEGMGMLRRLPEGCRLGPVYAKDVETAEALVKQLLQAISRHDTLIVDVHCGNTKACEWYKKLGLQEVLATSYMWKGDFTLDEEKVKAIYAMASLDFN